MGLGIQPARCMASWLNRYLVQQEHPQPHVHAAAAAERRGMTPFRSEKISIGSSCAPIKG